MSNASLQQLPEYHQRVKVRIVGLQEWLHLGSTVCPNAMPCPLNGLLAPQPPALLGHLPTKTLTNQPGNTLRSTAPCRPQVLQRMGYLNRDQSVTMKGRVACEVNSGARHLVWPLCGSLHTPRDVLACDKLPSVAFPSSI